MSKTTIVYKDIAPGAGADAEVMATGPSGLSDLLALPLAGVQKRTAVCERNYWALDGTAGLADGAPMSGFVSSALSGATGEFETPPTITINFDNQYSSVGVSFVFDDVEWCGKLAIAWYQGETQKETAEFTPDSAEYFCNKKVEGFDKLVITIKATSQPYRRAKISQILIGIIRTFGMDEIRKANIVDEMSLISTELPISTLEWTLDSRANIDFLFQLKQPITVKNGGTVIGIYYISNSTRTAGNVYNIKCEDAIGILEDSRFKGGAYLGGISATELCNDIIGGDFPIVVDVEDVTLRGIVQPGTKRAALQQVLFAWGAILCVDGETFRITDAGSTLAEIGADRTYTGVTVETVSPITKVQLTAHTYTQNNTGAIEIGGVKYADTTSVYEVSNPNVTASDKANVISITNATLVSTDIGQATAQRVYNYYLNRDKSKGKVVWEGEKLGDYVSLPTAWGSTTRGHISKMEIALSNTVAAMVTVEGSVINADG